MIDSLLNLDRTVSVAINSWHSPFWDSIMLFLSNKYAMIPLYALIVLYIIGRRKFTIRNREYYNSWKIVSIILLCCLAAFAFADIVGHDIIKPYFHRLRPGYDFYTWDLVRTPDGKGGAWSFVSNHAFNFFAFATAISLFVRRKWFSFFIFLLAAAVCYSRVYLARHFLGDVLCGALLGIITGYIFYRISAWIINILAYSRAIRKIR